MQSGESERVWAECKFQSPVEQLSSKLPAAVLIAVYLPLPALLLFPAPPQTQARVMLRQRNVCPSTADVGI